MSITYYSDVEIFFTRFAAMFLLCRRSYRTLIMSVDVVIDDVNDH
jgi:hypothetical protein